MVGNPKTNLVENVLVVGAPINVYGISVTSFAPRQRFFAVCQQELLISYHSGTPAKTAAQRLCYDSCSTCMVCLPSEIVYVV